MPAKGVQTTPPSRHRIGGVSIRDQEGAATGATGPLHAILVGDGDVPPRPALDAAWPGWADGARLVIGADGGACKAHGAGLDLDLVVGDADSLGPDGLAAVRAWGVELDLVGAAKDETDLELALLAAVGRGAARLTVLGALGGARFDHALANAWLLAHPALAGRTALLLDATTRVRLLDATRGAAEATLDGAPGDLVSLLPFGGEASGVTTAGLAYSLRDEPLTVGPARGISNLRTGERARISLRAGRLLIVETHQPPGVRP